MLSDSHVERGLVGSLSRLPAGARPTTADDGNLMSFKHYEPLGISPKHPVKDMTMVFVGQIVNVDNL